jgi:hypothetical protein
MGVARALPFGLLWFAGLALAKEPPSFRRSVAGAEVDWRAGTITAQGGSAADLRMPGPGGARPGAERRARAAAEDALHAALRELARGRKLDEKAVLARASIARVEYQSNGGVVLWLALRFSDLAPAKTAKVSLRVSSMPFSLAPTVVAGRKAATVAYATYRPASECPKDAVTARRDGAGRLLLPDRDAKLVDSLAAASVVIYLEKPQP